MHRVFPPDVLPGVLKAYMAGLKAAFAVAVSFCGVAFLASWAIPMGKLPSHMANDGPMAMG
jgi:MFS transporter, DHA2 family, glioxin efflux transporter